MHSDLVRFFDAPEKMRKEILEVGLKAKEILEVKKGEPLFSSPLSLLFRFSRDSRS